MIPLADFFDPTSFSLTVPHHRPPSNQPESEVLNAVTTEIQPQSPSLPAHEAIDITTNVPAEASVPEQMSFSDRASAKAGSFLRKVCAVLVFLSISIFFALQQSSLRKCLDQVLVLASSSLLYVAFEDFLIPLSGHYSSEYKKEHIFNVLDKLLALFFLLVVNIQDNPIIGKYLMLLSPLLFILTTALYMRKSAHSTHKTSKVLLRFFSTIQVSLITAKSIGYVKLQWMVIFMPFIIYFGSFAIYGLYSSVKSLVKTPTQERAEGESLKTLFVKNLIRTSWYILYYGLYLLAIVILISLCKHGKHGSQKGMRRMLIRFAGYYTGFLLCYTLVFIQLIKKLKINIFADQNEEEDFALFMNYYEESRVLERKHSLKPQENSVTSYFTKSSPTYFVKIEGDDKYFVSKETQENKETPEESLCYICEINQPNTILMGCGHGGMCLDCAKASILKKNNCMECRRPVESIYKIEKDNNKQVEATQVLTVIVD